MTTNPQKSKRLTPTEIKIIVLLLRKAEKGIDKVVISKKELSELYECNIDTIHETIRRLRKRGIVRAHMRYDYCGGQLASAYELVQEQLAEFLPQIQVESPK